VHLVGFAIEMYYDTRPYERQIHFSTWEARPFDSVICSKDEYHST